MRMQSLVLALVAHVALSIPTSAAADEIHLSTNACLGKWQLSADMARTMLVNETQNFTLPDHQVFLAFDFAANAPFVDGARNGNGWVVTVFLPGTAASVVEQVYKPGKEVSVEVKFKPHAADPGLDLVYYTIGQTGREC